MVSQSEENYLKTIFHLEKRSTKGVNTNALAQAIDSKASSVTEMIKKLSGKKLVNYKPYQGVNLSEKGRSKAIAVIRKHRLWEYFLVKKLNFSWNEVHEIAEQLEHIKSEKLIFELDKYLDFPKKDPHGDPIPDAEGNFSETNNLLLAEVQENENCICVGVKDTSPEFLEFLDRKSISLGTELKVLAIENFDSSLKVQIADEISTLSGEVSTKLYVKKER